MFLFLIGLLNQIFLFYDKGRLDNYEKDCVLICLWCYFEKSGMVVERVNSFES